MHPCKCTLVAHESCLLQWIQTSQQNASRAPNALKCPQCGSIYELESDNPMLLRLLNAGNTSLSLTGRAVTIASMAGIVASFSTGGFVLSPLTASTLRRLDRRVCPQHSIWSLCIGRVSWKRVRSDIFFCRVVCLISQLPFQNV